MKIALITAALVALEVVAAAEPTRSPDLYADRQSPEELYAAGQAAYDRADYATAIARWQAAYRRSGASVLLFNIAQAYRLSGDCVDAIASYQKFAATDPDPTSEQRQIAAEFVRELTPTCVARSADAPPDRVPGLNVVGGPSRTGSGDTRAGRALKIAGLATCGAGALSIAIGLALGHHGQTIGSAVTAACAAGCDWSAQAGNDSIGRRDASIGYALDGLGAAAIVGGTIMYYLGDRRDEIVVTPRPREGGVVISWNRTW